MTAKTVRWIALLLLVSGVSVWPDPASAILVGVTADTSALAGTAAQLEFDLFGLDDRDGNNTALLAGPAVDPPVLLTDAGGLGQLLQNTVLGSSLEFTADLSSVFEPGSAQPDRFAFFVLDPATSFSLVDTDLEGDALLRADLVGGALAIFAAAVTTPSIPLQVQAVPEASSLLLIALGLTLLRVLWPGCGAQRRGSPPAPGPRALLDHGVAKRRPHAVGIAQGRHSTLG